MNLSTKDYTEQLEIAKNIHLITKLNVYLVHNGEIILFLNNYYNDYLFHQEEIVLQIVHSIKKNNFFHVEQIKNAFSLEYLATEIPYSSAIQSFLVVGPFISETFSEFDSQRETSKKNLSFEDKNRLEHAYRSLSNLNNDEIYAIKFLILNLLNNNKQLLPTNHSISSLKTEQLQDTIIAPIKDIKSIEDRYKFQDELKKVIQMGDIEKIDQYSQKNKNFFLLFKDRVGGDYLRSAKNAAIIGNTSNRLAAEEVGVHPKHLDDISEKYAIQIEKKKTVTELMNLSEEMLEEYTLLVKNYAFENYSSVVKKILNFIQFHLTEDIHLDNLAEKLNMNKTYLCKRFKEETGYTIIDYINSKRIKEAEHFILNTNTPITEIAYLLGFNDYSYFSKVFKKKTGISPGRYSSQYKKKK